MSMENPYRAPEAEIRVVGVKSGRREDLKSVAQAQKILLICILIQIVAAIARFLVPQNVLIFVLGAMVLASLVATVFVFILAMRVYSTGIGILLSILTLVPCLGLIILLVVNQKATTILTQNGYKVGLLGADMSRF
jgi:hypothetical protein